MKHVGISNNLGKIFGFNSMPDDTRTFLKRLYQVSHILQNKVSKNIHLPGEITSKSHNHTFSKSVLISVVFPCKKIVFSFRERVGISPSPHGWMDKQRRMGRIIGFV